eukprot:GHRQ01006352.1.p1 GENE.GHRQ01006352.1~~GHRQ01006352.1.p1  ORF type:complete len:140 (+),score=12.75 GHRQ01006352.1:61-480(+)
MADVLRQFRCWPCTEIIDAHISACRIARVGPYFSQLSRQMGTSQQKDQRCCLGMLYYSQALEAQGKRPVCLGVPHTPSEPVQVEDNFRQLSGASDFKFMCVGHSLYRTAQKTSSSDAVSSDAADTRILPYCEGLEVRWR